MIIDVQGPSIWTLENPGTFLVPYYIWGLSGLFVSTRYFLPAINICSGRRVLIRMTQILVTLNASRVWAEAEGSHRRGDNSKCRCKYHLPPIMRQITLGSREKNNLLCICPRNAALMVLKRHGSSW